MIFLNLIKQIFADNCYDDVSNDTETAASNKNLETIINKRVELKKTGSIRDSARREGITAVNEKNNSLGHVPQINRLKLSEFRHSSDSEGTPRTSRRSRTQSLDKTDSWSTTNIKINR